jgi:hypothetical protein
VTLSGYRGYWDLRVKNAEARELPNYAARAQAANGGYTGYQASGSLPPVETVTVQTHHEEPNAPTLTEDDLQGIFDNELTEEEIQERRERGLGDQPGTMQPVEN